MVNEQNSSTLGYKRGRNTFIGKKILYLEICETIGFIKLADAWFHIPSKFMYPASAPGTPKLIWLASLASPTPLLIIPTLGLQHPQNLTPGDATGGQAFIATSLSDPSISTLPITVKQNSQRTVGGSTHYAEQGGIKSF